MNAHKAQTMLALCCGSGAPSVALDHGSGTISERLPVAGGAGNELLLQSVARLFERAPCDRAGVVAYAAGPGSFTGLRVGVAMAQALGFAWGVPLVPVSSLALTALAAARAMPGDAAERRILVLEDARMGDLYVGRYLAGAAGIAAETADALVAGAALALEAGSVDVVVGGGLALLTTEQRAAIAGAADLTESVESAGSEAVFALELGRAALRNGDAEPPEAAHPRYLRTEMGYRRVGNPD